MGLFPYTNAPAFVAGAELPVTGGVTTLERNVALLDYITRGGRDLFQAHSHAFEPIGDNPLRYWAGTFRYRTGMTTLTVVMDNQVTLAGISPRLRILINGVTKQETVITAGVQTITYASLAAQGYTDGQILTLDLQIFDPTPSVPGTGGWPGRFHLVDMHLSPVAAAMTTSWPGTPTFTVGTALDVAKLNQLSNASDWLALRLNLIPHNVFQIVRAMPGLYFLDDDGDPIAYPIWSGGLGAGRGTMTRLKVRFAYVITGNAAESFSLRINGSQVVGLGPYAAGASGITTMEVNLSGYGSSTPLRVELYSIVTAGNEAKRQSRYTVTRAWVEQPSVSALTTIQESFPAELINYTTLVARLNAISAGLAAIKSRIDNDPDTYNRARPFRRGYGYDDGQRTYFATRHLPMRLQRIGAGLIVWGSNMEIGWGAQTIVPPKKDEPDGEYDVNWSYTESLVSGDQRAVKVVSLDNLAGLKEGFAYVLEPGDQVYFAAEYLLR
jgi:hypothetical protein